MFQKLKGPLPFGVAPFSSQWEDLPKDVFFKIADHLHPDDRWRLTAVCKTWKRHDMRPSTFGWPPSGLKSTSLDGWSPIKVPSMDNVDDKRQYVVNKSTVYCVYPRDGGSGKGNGWMFKVSKTDLNNDTFSLLVPLSTEKIKAPTGNFPKTLSGLDSTVIGRSYSLAFIDLGTTHIQPVKPIDVRRTIVLQNYIWGCDFVVLTLRPDGKIHYWKPGDVSWTILETDNDYMFDDVVLFKGECYATDKFGDLFLIDSSLRVTKIIQSNRSHPSQHNSLVVGLNSELYMVQKISLPVPEYFVTEDVIGGVSYDPNYPMYLRFLKLNMRTRDWEVGDLSNPVLGDQLFFLGDDVTFSVSFKDFDGCKKDFVYLTDSYFDNEGSVYGKETGVFDSFSCELEALASKKEYAKCFWPPPSWLMMEAGCLER